MLYKKIFILIACSYFTNSIFAQYYIQPQFGFFEEVSRTIGNPPNFAKTRYHSSLDYDGMHLGLLVGKKSNKIEQQLGYFFHHVGIYTNVEKPFAGWGTAYMVTHNLSYGLNYSFLHWKRLDLRLGSYLHLCIPRLTWPSPYSKSSGVTGYQDMPVESISSTTAYERTQLNIEPYLDLNIRLFKRITWNLHRGYNFGFRRLYVMDSEYTISGIPQPKGSTETKGSGNILSTGFKFYFKNKKNAK